MKGIANRRHQRQRNRAHAEKVLRAQGIHNEEWIQNRIPRVADNLKVCSCEGCCNPRRSKWSSGQALLTTQEKKAWNADDYE